MNEDDSNNWDIFTEGIFLSDVRKKLLKDNISEEGIQNIIINAVRILSQCPNPNEKSYKQTTGIVIGKVQSGKTSNFISLIALAFDNAYDIVIVLGGTKKILVNQNSKRLGRYFEAHIKTDIVILNSSENSELLCENEIKKFLNQDKKIIIVVLKNKKNINMINKLIFKNTVLSDKTVLIIDDEGDEASLNGLVKKREKTSTYRCIEDLKASIGCHAFISVTATPQANILIDTCDILSPDFGVLIEPGKGYYGLEEFHNTNSKYMVPIPDNEIQMLEEQGVPQSLIDALSTFFVACGIRIFRTEQKNTRISMLIHPSVAKIDHKKVATKVDDIIRMWSNVVENEEDIAYPSLQSIMKNAYNRYVNDGVELPCFEALEKHINYSIRFSKLHIINSYNNVNESDDFYQYNIYVGGNMLGRGLTIEGLTVTYIIRTAKGVSNVDTLQQRARWLGYREEYLDLCRVFATKKIINQFEEIRIHELDLWDTIHFAQLQGKKFKNITRIFALSDKLRMTRSNVASTSKYIFSFWNVQRVFETDKSIIDNNNHFINKLRDKYKNQISEMNFGDKSRPHKVLYDLDFFEIVDSFLCNLKFPLDSALDESIIMKISQLLKKIGVKPKLDIIWMRDGEPGIHNMNESGRIAEYMVGRRPSDLNKPVRYKGDRYMMNDRETFQLQIHQIKDVSTEIQSPMFAFYIPKKFIDMLSDLVIKD